MRSYTFSLAFILLAALPARAELPADSVSRTDSILYLVNTGNESGTVFASRPHGSSRYDKRVRRYRRHWASLIPTHHTLQFAGNMGLLSAGVGWEYGKRRQWELDLLFGVLPKYNSRRTKMTMTIKSTYIPWSTYMKRGWSFEPLSCGLYVNTVFGSEFWSRQPDRYPDQYYPLLATKLRANVFVGQRIGKTVPGNRRKLVKQVTAFYEISTCDLYVRAMFMDDHVCLRDILSLSFGVRLQLL